MPEKTYFSIVDYSCSQKNNPMIHLVTQHGFVSCIRGEPDEIEAITKQTAQGLTCVMNNITRKITVFHIDMGYNDFWILKHCMKEFERRQTRPWIVCIPFNNAIPLSVACTVPWGPSSHPVGFYHTCSLLALIYTLPGYSLFGCSNNRICYFVLSEHAKCLKQMNSTIHTPHLWNTLSQKFWVTVRPRKLQ